MRESRRLALVAGSVMLSTLIQVLDTTIANVALPHMQGSLSASSEQITWVLTSYIVAAAILTLPVGYLTRVFGRRRVLLWSVAGFTVASMLCGQAQTLGEMVAFRILQGVFGAALVPLSQSVLLEEFPPERHAGAMGIWGMGVMIGPVVGPTLGGWLTEYYNWRWVFYINLPFGMLSFAGIWLFVSETPRRRQQFDLLGFALLALALASLQLLLDRGELLRWFESREIRLYLLLIVAGMGLFLAHTLTSRERFFSPALFRDRNFLVGTLFIFAVGMVLLATMVLLPPFLQVWKGYPVATTGVVLMPRGVGTMISMLLAGRLTHYIDSRVLVVIGMLLVAVSLYQMSGYTLDVGQAAIVSAGFVQGLGLGLVFVPVTALAYATLAPALRDEAAALYSLSRNLGTSVGVSIVMAQLSRKLWINQQELAARLNPDALAGIGLPDAAVGSQVPVILYRTVLSQAAEIAYANAFYLLFWITVAAIPMVFLLRRPVAQTGGG